MLTLLLGEGGDLKGAVKMSGHCLEISKLDICIMKAVLSFKC